MSAAPTPSVNGVHLDLHRAAEALYGELKGLPWFLGVVTDEKAGVLIVEARDAIAATQRLGDRFHGWSIRVEGKQTAAYRPVKVIVPEEPEGMVS